MRSGRSRRGILAVAILIIFAIAFATIGFLVTRRIVSQREMRRETEAKE